MFKGLQWKVVSIFVLLVMAILSVTGTFLIFSVNNVHHDMFAKEMDTLFTETFIGQLEAGGAEYTKNVLGAHTVRMGIDSYRNYYILSAENFSVVDSSADRVDMNFMQFPNVIAALSGEVGRAIRPQSATMDFAVPVSGSDFSYIIYIQDTKEELTMLIQQIFSIILQALLLGVAISLVMGYFLSRTITTPIANLTKKAKRLAEGEFETKIEVKSRDEIGTLTETFNDMSSKLQAAMLEMSTEKNKVEAILLNMTDGVMAFATDGSVIHINPTARKMFGLSENEALSFDEFFESHGTDVHLGDMLYLEDHRFVERDIAVNNLTMKASFVLFEDELDNTGGVLVVLHDVTRQQKLENARREFVANVSHELRTPLTTVKSYTETILDMLDPTAVPVSFLNTIINETDRMTRLVKDLLVLSSLEREDQLSKTEFDISGLVKEVVDTLDLVVRDQGHRLSLKLSGKFHPIFYGDRDRLEQLLYNIISNAIKYTPNGGKIEVFAEQQFNTVTIRVKDNGIGIPEKDLGRLFERFYRVDKARSREKGGTGLGLAISKSIVDAHGGTISIASEVNKGTEVTIKLPVFPPELGDAAGV